jgi:AraC family transcriptional regulator of adaptative response/methylated-DNA-[protein]-cysteine methyltransferase
MTADTRATPRACSGQSAIGDIFPRDAVAYGFGLTSLGAFAVASNEHGVCAILLGDDTKSVAAQLGKELPGANLVLGGNYGYFDIIVGAVAGLIERPWIPSKLEFDLRGGDFERMTRAALRLVEPGQTITPEEVAFQIGARGAAQNVREVAARDLMAVAAPFHRLQEADGMSPSYRWGEARRRAILQREQLKSAWSLYSLLPGPHGLF